MEGKVGLTEKETQNEDLRNMLMTFRISELQSLLCACGRSRSGRKHELMGRALNLLKSGEGTPLRNRIKAKVIDLYSQRFPSRMVPPSLSTQASNSSSTMYNQSQNFQSFPSNEKLGITQHHHLVHQPTTRQFVQSSGNSSSRNTNMVPVHPDVRFIDLPFYETVDVLVRPTNLKQKALGAYQEIAIVFHLSPHQVQLIQSSRTYTIQSRIEYSVQVQLRFCLNETSCVQEDLYPSRLCIKVNGKICPVPGQPPPTAQNPEPKKPHRPVNITSLCQLSPLRANQIVISWMPSEMGQTYAVAVQLSRSVTVGTLIQKLKDKGERNADHSRALIKEKLFCHDHDNELATTSLKSSLCCPIGKTKMTMPCRALSCNHFQCFDGSLYVRMNERKPNWTCPVCDKKAYYDQLFIDGLFSEIIRTAPQSCTDVQFYQDASWKPVLDPSEDESKFAITNLLSTPDATDTKSKSSNSVIDADSVSSTDKNRDVDIIDLTGDSDEEEEVRIPKEESSTIRIHNPQGRGPRLRQVPISSPYMPFSAPSYYGGDFQDIDLLSLLPQDDRVAALYLEQSGLVNQLNQSSRGSPSEIISLD